MPDLLNRSDAAAARGLKLRSLADRPTQRSCERSGTTGRLWTPAMRAAITMDERKASDPAPTSRAFQGMASVTGQKYEMYDWYGPYDEQVMVGAFEQTLAQSDLDVPLVIDHTSSRRIARTNNASSPLELTEIVDGDLTGLQCNAPTLQLADSDSAWAIGKLDSKLLDEMSFRFTIDDGRWSEDFMTFTIRSVNIHRGDVSIVGYGANPSHGRRRTAQRWPEAR